MSSKLNLGSTLTTGIQDLSALLPLLGTEQCERHAGSALEKGFLYAAVTSLSIFGSLGIVKTAFATLLATITFPFYGGKWLDDAGFGTLGSVSSMVTIAKGGVEYGAEAKFVKLLEEQHIDDLDLVAGVEWSGWQKSIETQSDSPSTLPSDSLSTLLSDSPSNLLSRPWWMSMSWNMKLILISALAALISVSPYLYLISSDWTDPFFWFFPLLRAFGSFLSVVAIQLALQLRIHHIIRGRLLLMKATKSSLKHRRDRGGRTQAKSFYECEWDANRKDTLEQRLCKLSKHSDSEKWIADRDWIVDHQELANILSINWHLIAYQLIMVIGIPMIVIGYIGCFTLVSRSTVAGGPYVWLGMEAMLSVLRLVIWGWNPEWDESTGMRIKLNLSHGTPLVTTPYDLRQLEDKRSREYSFVICNENDFLAAATRYTGPLQRFVSSNVSLFYSLVANHGGQFKHLLTTILDLHTRTTQTFYVDNNGRSRVFSSICELDPRTNAMRVTLDNELQWNDFHQDDVFNQVLDHSKQIASRLCENGRVRALDLQWTVSYPSPKSDLSMSEIAMNDGDRAYAEVGNQFINKSSFCHERGAWIQDYVEKGEVTWSLNEWTELGQGIEVLHLLESVVLEVYLRFKVKGTAQELLRTDTDLELTRLLSAERVHEMECRMSKEKESAMRRFDAWKIHDDVEQRILELWERASEVLGWLLVDVDHQLAEIVTILDRGDLEGLISTIFPYFDYWPSNWTNERIRRILDSQVRWFVRRLKIVLQDGFPSSYHFADFAQINFAEDPYLSVDDASAHVLGAIRLNSSLRVIRLARNLLASDIDKILEIVADKDTLTTLIFESTLSARMLENNRRVLFLPGVACEQPCTLEHSLCDLVHRNRQEWRDSASSAGLDMTYTVGFSSSGTSCGIYPTSDKVGLEQDAACLIMVYTQTNRQLKLSLHYRQGQGKILSVHIFFRSGGITSASKWEEHSISREVIPEHYANQPHEIVTPELAAGYHEIRIQIEGDYSVHYLCSVAVTRESDADNRLENVAVTKAVEDTNPSLPHSSRIGCQHDFPETDLGETL